MDGGWLTRLRWRHRGAWMWPAFGALTLADAALGHALPPSGESQRLMGAALVGCFLNLLAIVLLSRPVGAVLRKLRPDLPRIVARDYGGMAAMVLVAAVLLTAGLFHHPTLAAHKRAMADAISRAQAWIGVRAPAEFRRNVRYVSTYVIEPGSVYRTCVPSDLNRRTYCVVVKVNMPLTQSVRFDGYESNAVFASGTS